MHRSLTSPAPPPGYSALRLFTDCVVLGFTAWGGFMALLAQAQERFVRKRGWVVEKDFLDLIALVTMLPGPQAVNALAVMGHRLGGWAGFTAALAGIVLPSFFIILGLWWGYAALAGHPALLRAVIVGVLPPLAMILAQTAWNQSKKAAPARRDKALALVAAAALLLLPFWSAPILVLAAGGLVARLFWPAPPPAAAPTSPPMRPAQVLLCLVPAGFAVFQIVPALLPDAVVARLALAFAGISTTLFGGALVMVPLLEGLIVEHLGWLSHAGFTAGLAASQLTPGPIVGIATFTGMEIAGFAGALAATVGVYTPTAVIAVGASGAADRLKGLRWFQHAMLGVRCAVVGLIAGAAVTLWLKLPLAAQPLSCAALTLAAALLVFRLKQPPYVTIPAGVLLAWLLMRA
ncbi:chromate transporter [Rubrivivax gelatinosus]|uniref:chromate efflux transporter n=1 Tax=Rubrivivax gelatinosus TaxID=28068 RepID=UPI001905D57E|nr:chromate efflux transporter [Rubrivivax gelatinosus]MBK1613240.1 chromate transporter [Rubrivivax gelatinosus]